MSESWDGTLEEWTTAYYKEVCAAGLAQQEDGAFYAAAPVAEDAGWGHIYKDDHEEEIMQEDGETMKKVMINEAATLKAVVDTLETPPNGLWLGGKKYRICRVDKDFENGDFKYDVIHCACPKGGCTIAKSKTQIIVCFFDEEKGGSKGNCSQGAMG